MARLARYTQQVFGSSAGANQMAQYGSLAASAPLTYSGSTITPAIVQALSNYLTGWFGAVIGANSPAEEDMNSLFYLLAYQLTYLFQLGVAEWDAGTTYYTGSIAQDGAGNLYISLTNANLNNALTSATNWKPFVTNKNIASVNPAGGTYASPYTLTSANAGQTFLVNSANGAMTFNLPAPSLNYSFKVKDSGFLANTNAITFHRHSTENFENLAADYIAQANGGEWEIASDGTNWFIVGR